MATKLSVYNEALRILGEARIATVTDDVEARFALDDAWTTATTFVLEQAPWRFALLTAALTHSSGEPALAGYSYRFAKPATWLRTHSFFTLSGARECPLDMRQQGTTFYANVASPNIRYVSSTYTDPTYWTEPYAKAVAAYLAYEVAEKVTGDGSKVEQVFQIYQQSAKIAIERDAVAEDRWLAHQQSGAYARGVRHVLELGLWRFAIKTVSLTALTSGTPSNGYAYAFTKPADWLRTVQLYRLLGESDPVDIDYRDEDGKFHANSDVIAVRYLSTTLGEDASQWSEAFYRAVLAYLDAHGEQPSAAMLEGRIKLWQAALTEAKSKDDMRERPKVNQTGRFVMSRRANVSREHY